MTVQGGVERVKAKLEKEERDLIHMKEAVQQQLKVLQAEAVTIQRLLHAQSRQLVGGGGEHKEEEVHMEPPPDRLPELNLDIEPGARQRSPALEEMEDEEEEEEDEDDHG